MSDTNPGAETDGAQPGAETDADPRPAAVTFVTTEHFTLQGARAAARRIRQHRYFSGDRPPPCPAPGQPLIWVVGGPAARSRCAGSLSRACAMTWPAPTTTTSISSVATASPLHTGLRPMLRWAPPEDTRQGARFLRCRTAGGGPSPSPGATGPGPVAGLAAQAYCGVDQGHTH